MEEPGSLMIPYPELDSTIGGITKPFQYDVWIYIIISLVVCALFLWLISAIESSWTGHRVSRFVQNFWFLLSVFINPNDCILKTLAAKLLGAAWCLMAIVLVNSYTSSLASYLMAPRYHPLVNSIEDVAAIGRPMFMVPKDSSYETILLEAKSGTFLQIANTLREHPELLLPSMDNASELVANYKRSFTTEKSVLLSLMEEDLKATGNCRVYLAKEKWLNVRDSFALQKNSPYTSTFNRDIIWLQEVGLLDYYQRMTWSKENRCSAPLLTTKPRNTTLTFSYLYSVFLLYVVGVVASFVIFILEQILWYFSRSRKRAHQRRS